MLGLEPLIIQQKPDYNVGLAEINLHYTYPWFAEMSDADMLFWQRG